MIDERIRDIDSVVVRKEKDKIYVLGTSGEKADSPAYELHRIVHDSKTLEIIEEQHFKALYYGRDVLSQAFSFVGVGIPFLIYNKTGDRPDRKKLTAAFLKEQELFQRKNNEELRKTVKHIKIYQSSIYETEKILDKELEIVDTGFNETFIKAENSLDLMIKAHVLGADAIVMYQPGSEVGTPVKFKKIK